MIRTATPRMALLALAAALAPSPAAAGALEAVNRTAHALNAAALHHVIAPVAAGYEAAVPVWARAAAANVFANLREPATAAFSGAQGDLANARVALARFAINSTLGLLGVHDRAAEYGLVSRPTDLGQALCALGAPEGPYLVLPLYGPGTLRDVAADALALGMGLSLGGEGVLAVAAGDRLAGALENGDELAAATAGALDAYAVERSAHLQARRAACPGRIALSPPPGTFGGP